MHQPNHCTRLSTRLTRESLFAIVGHTICMTATRYHVPCCYRIALTRITVSNYSLHSTAFSWLQKKQVKVVVSRSRTFTTCFRADLRFPILFLFFKNLLATTAQRQQMLMKQLGIFLKYTCGIIQSFVDAVHHRVVRLNHLMNFRSGDMSRSFGGL